MTAIITDRQDAMSSAMYLSANDTDFDLVTEQWGWDFAPKRFSLLAKAAWWLLGKLDAVSAHIGTHRVYRFEAPKESDGINEAVFNAMDGRIRSRGDMKDYAILMGQEDFMVFMRESGEFLPLGSLAFKFEAGPFSYRGHLYDVPVHVVETVKGVALVPRVVIESHRS